MFPDGSNPTYLISVLIEAERLISQADSTQWCKADAECQKALARVIEAVRDARRILIFKAGEYYNRK